ncbi:CBS domain-containing protein [Streptomyces griseocarneus]|uniref:CBS domain-containing protein n=1 Tax=Streptomyces griseocarneus TaxID=51201 RepID=UPI00167C79FD|nr:CBS domain-containing protein [Streptomyces griseocarneus]MBZ6473553.1 CBS domain-containing protein [Streptomyces griseocarneus]GHG56338.1 hypoxic response protein 1 [Streptomyces griseocarneus]
MTTAKEIMHPGAHWLTKSDTLERAAQLMRDLDIGALPVADEDNNERLCGIITDRDIVVKCIAEGRTPAECSAEELCEGTPRWVDANADITDVLHEMEDHRIKRVPVVENKRVVGIISEADLAQHLTDDQIAEFAEMVYARR